MADSLRDRILSASTDGAIKVLLNEGANYEYASGDTRRRWEKAAEKRRDELHPKPKATPKAAPSAVAPAKQKLSKADRNALKLAASVS